MMTYLIRTFMSSSSYSSLIDVKDYICPRYSPRLAAVRHPLLRLSLCTNILATENS